jgi:cyclic beta-1,2-glucan synthetase
VQGAALVLDPCIPRAWPGFSIEFKYLSARYQIEVENPKGVSRGVSRLELDGQPLPDGSKSVQLADDAASHRIRVVLG